jgi:hypothetical protein
MSSQHVVHTTAQAQREWSQSLAVLYKDARCPMELYYRFDILKLKTLIQFSDRNDRAQALHRRYQARKDLHVLLRECAQDGKVLVIESGMDCDCVQYDGRQHLINATIEAYDKLYNDVAEWADGPFSFSITSPSEARYHTYRSVDLVMEAYENGHRHSIRPHAVI